MCTRRGRGGEGELGSKKAKERREPAGSWGEAPARGVGEPRRELKGKHLQGWPYTISAREISSDEQKAARDKATKLKLSS